MARCNQILLGSGTDTYDPICELPKGHSGICRSTSAIDQHRLDTGPLVRPSDRLWHVWVCPVCDEVQPRRGIEAHCAGSLTENTAHDDAPMEPAVLEVAA